MFDRFNRRIDYLRISVTDRCNLRCVYCMPEEGVVPLRHEDILSYEEMAELVRVGVRMGLQKIRVTGGEPLVRAGIVDFIRMLSEIDGIRDISMTTNGILLEQFAKPLKEAGLQRINISLDTMDPERYRVITRRGELSSVLNGITAARRAGLEPVKINCVVNSSIHENDAIQVKEFCLKMGLEVRFIHRMDLQKGIFNRVEGGDGGNCRICNRLRLTANGKIKPCLFNDLEFDVRQMGPEQAILSALQSKPAAGTFSFSGKFNAIGG
jgi:cyclic pyranopterin phosphate synthase